VSSQGPAFPASASNNTGIGTLDWTNLTHVTAADGSYVNNGGGSGSITHYLLSADHSFSIPAGATISGIVAEVRIKSQFGVSKDTSVKLAKGGVIGGNDNASSSTIGTTDTWLTFGANNDLWGQTWSVSDINASNFGLAFAAKVTGSTDSLFLDAIRITVYYSTPTGTSTSTGPSYFALTADSGSPGSSDAWNTPDKAESAPDGVYASNNDATSGTTYLNFTQWQGSAIPDNATVVGITVAFFGHATGGTGSDGYNLGLIHSGASLAGTSHDKTLINLLAASDAWSADQGSASDLWSATLTPAIVNDTTFGVQVRCTFGAGGFVASIDSARMTIYWQFGPIELGVDSSSAVAERHAVLKFRTPQFEEAPVSTATETPHVDGFEPLHVRPNMPPPRARWLYDPQMGFPDPASFTLPNAPEPLHPENYPAEFVQRRPQPYATPWNVPLMASTDFTGLLSGESSHPEVTHQIEQANPRRNPPRQYQPRMSIEDPGQPTVSSTPLAILPGMSQPAHRLRRIQPPAIEVTSLVTATPGDQSVYPTGFTMQAMPTSPARRVQQAQLQQTIIDAFSGQQFPIQPMAVPARRPARVVSPAIETAIFAPQQLSDSQIIGWNVPLSIPVRPRRPAQNIALQAEVAGETVDLALIEPASWQPSEPASLNARLRPNAPHLERLTIETRTTIDADGWATPFAQPVRRPAPKPPANESLLPFTEITTANSEFMRSMGGPVRQLPKPLVSPKMAGVETTPQAVAPPYALADFAPGMQQPVKQSRRVQQFAIESVALDTISLAPALPIQPMALPARTARQQRQAANIEPPYSDAVNAAASSVAFMGMTPQINPRLRPPIVGMHFQAAPAVLQTQFIVEPMYAGNRRFHKPQQASTAIIVDQQYFAGVPNVADYQTAWIVPKQPTRRQSVPIESASTTSFFVGGNPATFAGSGAFVVVAGAVYSLAPVAGKVTRASKGI
jgi:hypothetical protein